MMDAIVSHIKLAELKWASGGWILYFRRKRFSSESSAIRRRI